MVKQNCLSLWLVSTDDCEHTWFTTKNGMVPPWLQHGRCIVCFKQSHRDSRHCAKIQLPVRKILLLGTSTLKCCSQMDFKGTHNNGKDLLTNRKDPWAESKGLIIKPFYRKIYFQGLKRTKTDPGNLKLINRRWWLFGGYIYMALTYNNQVLFLLVLRAIRSPFS